METLKLTKLDVALRQLNTAIELWANDDDPVSVHALAFAAHEIIHVLYRKQGHKDLLFDSSIIRDEYRADFGRSLKESANFIKHAKNDSDKTLDFDPQLSEIFLNASIIGLQIMKVPLDDLRFAYLIWLQVHRPNWFSKSIFKEGVSVEVANQVRSFPKRDFFKAIVEIRREGKQK
jgi:hypothetical protein